MSLLLNNIYQRCQNYNHPILIADKVELRDFRSIFQQNYRGTVSHQWVANLRAISYREADQMYSQINNLFHKKPGDTVLTILVPTDEVDLLVGADIDDNTAITDTQGNHVVSDATQSLNLIGNYFKTISQPHLVRGSAMLAEIVEQRVHDFKATLNETPILHLNASRSNLKLLHIV